MLGPNGSGKTTLVNLLSENHKNYKGDILISGKNKNSFIKKEISKIISFAPQKISFPSGTTVEEIVMMGRFAYSNIFGFNTKKDKQIAWKYSKYLNIDKLWKKDINELSGGQQQRVILAMCLTQETPIIILDEPTNHLDIKYQISLIDILKELKEKYNKTIIICLHDINIAANELDEMFLLKKGNLVANGTNKILNNKLLKKVYDAELKVINMNNHKFITRKVE